MRVLLTADAVTGSAQANSGGSGSTILLFVVIALVLVFLVVNGRRKAKAAVATQAEIDVGSTVVTRAGLIATLVLRTDDYVILQLEDGTRARFVPQAVARVWEEPGGSHDNLTPEPVRLDKPSMGREPPAGPGPLAD